ncbi:MAG: hypothetical protein JWQ43_1717 [Glaciihabitans sp.]|nr:hypothetical protein [Glaciihabitans sp.]
MTLRQTARSVALVGVVLLAAGAVVLGSPTFAGAVPVLSVLNAPSAGAPPVVPYPALSTVTPSAGSTQGGARVKVTGSGFIGAVRVLFGGLEGTNVLVVSDTELYATTPARATQGSVNVRVFSPSQRSASDSPVHYRFVTPPAITAVDPASSSDAGGNLVTITGTHLNGTTEVLFGQTPASVVTVSYSTVRVISPTHRGSEEIAITLSTPGGTSAVDPATAFTYAETPSVTALSPHTGTLEGGTEVTLRGAHLADVSAATFGRVAATNVRVLSDSEVRVTTPARTAVGDVTLSVTTSAGTTTQIQDWMDYSYVAPAAAFQEKPVRHSYIPLGLIGVLSWSIWFIRRFLSRHRYRPVVNDFRTTTSVVVPVYREDAKVLERCLYTWLAEDPTEVILVVDDTDDALLSHIRGLDLDRVKVLEWRHTGKRGALGAGVREARGEIVVFADSDTQWRPGLLASMQMPFVDPKVGGVGSRQHVYLPRTNVWRRVAYWMLNTRYLDYVPAMSRRGGVACLSGRTAAYRREVILPLMPALEKEIFLGRECVAGDDGRLTWLVLASGFRTVHQDTAEADSMFPAELTAFVRQRIRWSRNSYRCYLTALSQGWLWHQPLITQVTVLQILLTPVSMGAAIWYGLGWIREGGWIAVSIVLGWAVVGRALRGLSHLSENPKDIVMAPLIAVVIAAIALPIKFWAALTMNKQGWLTRQEGQRVQGQQEIEVVAHASQG